MNETLRGLAADLGVLTGLALVALGVFQLSVPAGWIFVGAVIVGVNLILLRPPPTTPPSRPSGAP